jgi:hypothetical protein
MLGNGGKLSMDVGAKLRRFNGQGQPRKGGTRGDHQDACLDNEKELKKHSLVRKR